MIFFSFLFTLSLGRVEPVEYIQDLDVQGRHRNQRVSFITKMADLSNR